MQTLDDVGPGLAEIARAAVAAELAGHAFQAPAQGPAAPVFVTIREQSGALRGCIGTLAAAEHHVCQETARNAVLAALRDPRFPPIVEAELPRLRFEVSVLMAEERVTGIEELDPSIYGVVVRGNGGRRGVLLPEVPGIETPARQVEVAREKAGILDSTPVELSRFRVRKYLE